MKNTNSYQSISGQGARMIFIALLFVFVFLSGKVFSQETENWNFDYASVGSGETPLSSGISIATSLTKGKHSLSCDYNSILGEMLYFYSPIK